MARHTTLTLRAIIILTILLVFLLSAAGCSQTAGGQQVEAQEELNPQEGIKSKTLTISAAASLTDVMEEIKKLYEEDSNVSLIMNYGSSGALQQQIEQGAPADLFISAAQSQMDALEKNELIIAESRINLLQNDIVLIVPANGNYENIRDFTALTDDNVRVVAIGDPESVPAGRYAKEVLTSLGLWEELEEKLVFAKDVRQVLTYVETENASAGIVYMTDAISSGKVTVASTAPESSHTPVTYPAAIVASSSAQKLAADFMAFLQEEEAKAFFEQSGFTFLTAE